MSTHKAIVFLADDDDAFRESAEEALEDAGYLVLSARDGLEALERMRGLSGRRAVAIVDLNMPGMDGWDLITTMRARMDLTSISILVVSAQGRAPVSGADRLLRKPVEMSELLDTVEELLCQPR